MSKRVYNKYHLLTVLITLFVLVFTVWLLKQTIITHSNNSFEAKIKTGQVTEDIALQFDQELSDLKAVTDDIRRGLTQSEHTTQCETLQGTDKTTTKCTEETLRIASLNNDGFYSLGVAFESGVIPLDQNQISIPPLAGDNCGGKHCRYAPYLVEQRGSIEKKRIDNYYDYRESEHGGEWYINALVSKPGWGPALREPAMDEWVVKYTQQLDDHKGDAIGVVFADIGLDWFRERIETHDLTPNGYAILVNESLGPKHKQVLYHGLESTDTIREYLDFQDRETGKSATGPEKTDPPDFMQEVLTFDRVGEGSTIRLANRLTGEDAWFNRVRIGESDLFLLTVMDFPNGWKEDDPYYSIPDIRNPDSAVTENLSSDRLKKILLNKEAVSGSGIITIIICIVSLITLIWLCYYTFFWHRITLRTNIVTTVAISGLFIAGIMAIWIIQYTFENKVTNASSIIPNSAVASAWEKEYSKISLERQYAPPRFIPTGIFVQSIEFASATNVSLTGYLWQRYPADSAIDDEPTVVFAEAITTDMDFAYRQDEGNDIVVGWYFETVLNERFNYSYFPFDRQSIWVRMWNRDFASNTVLVPDFQAYNSLNPRSIPGLEIDLPLFGWIPERSYFELRMNRYNSNFGQDKYVNRNGVPELYFNIDVKRNFLNPFISHLFSLMVILLMLFAITITISKRKENSDLLGFSVSSVIASCTALFFVVLIAHVQLRRELSANSVVYLEMFYFVSYVVILLTTVNAILFTWNVSVSFIQHQNNLIPKLLYWPFILGTMFVCTALTFWW